MTTGFGVGVVPLTPKQIICLGYDKVNDASILSRGSIAFVFDVVTPEDDILRYTIWRVLTNAQVLAWFPQSMNQDGSADVTYVTVQCNPGLIVARGSAGWKLERYWGEMSIDDFSFELYDAPSIGWFQSVSTVGTNIHPQNLKMSLSESLEDRLFTKYIKPPDDDPTLPNQVFCSIEFKPARSTVFTMMVQGQMKEAVKGSDKRWKHPKQKPLLDYATNLPFDAERTWLLQFAPSSLAGLSKLASAPSIIKPIAGHGTQGDLTKFYLPFYDPHSANSHLPYEILNGNLTIVQKCADVWGMTNSGNKILGEWKRHISLGMLVGNMLNAAVGSGNWDVQADDSPMEFQWGIMNTGGNLIDEGNIEEGQYVVINPQISDSNVMAEKMLLIPVCLFDLYELLSPSVNIPHPRVDNSWPKRYQAAIQVVYELSYILGYDLLNRVSDGKLHLKLVSRLNHNQPSFSTPTPINATPTAYPASEAGIKGTRSSTFRHARDLASDGVPYGNVDDWFAQRASDTPNSIALYPQANGYCIPATAPNPAELLTSLALMGPASGLDPSVAGGGADTRPGLGWYSLSLADTPDISSPYYTLLAPKDVDWVERAENFPTLAPLVPMNGNVENGGSIIVPQSGAPDPTKQFTLFAPAIRMRFTYKASDGTMQTVTSNSLRQNTSRFYSLFYVRSLLEYQCTYPGINRFYGESSNSPVPGDYSWQNIQLRFLIQLFQQVDQLYYVSQLRFDFDAWETSVALLPTTLDPVTFIDDNITAPRKTAPAIGPGGKSISGMAAGGTTSPLADVIMATGSPVNISSASSSDGRILTVVNASGAPLNITFTPGEGTNLTLSTGAVFQVASNGLTWTTLFNLIPGKIDYSSAPAHFNSTGSPGQLAYDVVGNFYYCYAPNLWGKLTGALSAW